ncbi:MAG: hypothetical protein KDD58_13200 [Bdellovibrionales bacterium]|nr:hypothetical protein [Bdellovibrionales bacterium]
MTISGYLKQFSNFDKVFLIGPLYSKKQIFKEPVIYVDRGVNFRNKHKGLSVGDGDSSPVELDVKLPPKKDYSDLSYALNNLSDNFNKIFLFGFLGGRKDHEIINITEAYLFLRNKSQIQIYFDSDVLILSSGEHEIHHHGVFSILTFIENRISLTGHCKYQMDNRDLKPLSSHGLSNESKGLIQLTNSNPLIVFLNSSIL